MEGNAEITRAARLMLENHGRGAARVAQTRADNLSVFGESEAAEKWRQIAAAIQRLQAGRS